MQLEVIEMQARTARCSERTQREENERGQTGKSRDIVFFIKYILFYCYTDNGSFLPLVLLLSSVKVVNLLGDDTSKDPSSKRHSVIIHHGSKQESQTKQQNARAC